MLVDQTQFLPERDNTTEGLASLLELNRAFRRNAWPKPFNATRHCLRLGDARDLSWIPSETIHLVVTLPPYWILKEYHKSESQLGEVQDYDQFLDAAR